MPDFIYMMETRLLPEQQRAVKLVEEAARNHAMTVYLTGGAVRDMISGFTIRDLDFTVQGNALKLLKDLEKAGAVSEGVDEDLKAMYLLFPGNVRAEIAMARSEKYEKPGRPQIAPAAIHEDLRRRDFTVNAMGLSLNENSRGLLLDPFNGVADIEAKLLRVLHNYSFLEEPSRLIRATRLAARFHWTIEERTQARYASAVEGDYIENISDRARGQEIEQIAYEDDPLQVVKVLEKEGWLKVLHPHWSLAKVDTTGLSQLLKTKQMMSDHGYQIDAAPAVIYYLTARLNEADTKQLQRLIPRRGLVDAWRKLEDEAKDLAKHLSGKEAATPSQTWKLLEHTAPERILFLSVTTKNTAVAAKLRNFFGKWREMKQRLPFPEMAEMRITPELPDYLKITEQAFLLLLDGKLRSHNDIVKFLEPYSPPPPPPPPAPRRGRAPKAEAAPAAPAPAAAQPKRRGKGASQPAEGAMDVVKQVKGVAAGVKAAAKKLVEGAVAVGNKAAAETRKTVRAAAPKKSAARKPAAKPAPRKKAAAKKPAARKSAPKKSAGKKKSRR